MASPGRAGCGGGSGAPRSGLGQRDPPQRGRRGNGARAGHKGLGRESKGLAGLGEGQRRGFSRAEGRQARAGR